MSSNKLHPIYVALDNQQYSRAIKLALALPKTNMIGQALLAHAYCKAGHSYKALMTIQPLIPPFPELVSRCQIESLQHSDESTTQKHPTPAVASTKSKGGKKGKKKTTASSTTNTAAEEAVSLPKSKALFLLELLDRPTAFPEDWERLPTNPSLPKITDEVILTTLAATLQTLKLPLTVYQLYGWASNDEAVQQKTYMAGISVLIAPYPKHVHTKVLANLQALTMQMTRKSSSVNDELLWTGWAAQTAVWQWQFGTDDDDNSKQRMLLPRLAESLALKCLRPQDTGTAEAHLLYIKTLQCQNKWEDILTCLDQQQLETNNRKLSDQLEIMALTPTQLLEQKAQVLTKMNRPEAAKDVYATLVRDYPDNWTYWQGFYQSCHSQEETERLLDQILPLNGHLRGPNLMRVDLVATQVKQGNVAMVSSLVDAILVYSTQFCHRAGCVFTDICPYLQVVMDTTNAEALTPLLEWAQTLRTFVPSEDTNDDGKARRSFLRGYVFSVRIVHKVKADLNKWAPSWQELVHEWHAAMTWANTPEQAQKESRPEDDLILLAVQQLLYENPTKDDWWTAAALLEVAIEHSPYNAYLRILAIDVYAHLDAVVRSYELFRELSVKHIQLESCTYLIIPLLVEGGLYSEAIEVCQEIMRLQTNSSRDTVEYIGRAMDCGMMSKADEFVVFQRNRLNKSLTSLLAKGLILDCAPFLLADDGSRKKNDSNYVLGGVQGVVGGEDDFSRATRMICERHNPYGAISLLGVLPDADIQEYSDNRDLSILSLQLLHRIETAPCEQLLHDSMRRGYHHNLLLRAVLCLHETKGPKKGKLVKNSEELTQSCSSLLSCVEAGSNLSWPDRPLYREFREVMLKLCKVLAMTSAGMPQRGDDDTLAKREAEATKLLKEASTPMQSAKSLLEQPSSELSVADVCRLLPDCIVPAFSLFLMCSDVLTTFGWGKRKRHTKTSAGAMADLAEAYSETINLLKTVLCSVDSVNGKIDPILSDHIDAEKLDGISKQIKESQKQTQLRVEPYLNYIGDQLESFNVPATG